MLKIAIVEDQNDIRSGIVEMIHSMSPSITGQVYEFSNAETVMESVFDICPEIILVDIVLEKATGLDLIAFLRKNNYNGKIIIISSHDSFNYAKKAIEYHVDDYILKPIKYKELYSLLLSVTDSIIGEQKKIKDLQQKDFKYLSQLIINNLSGIDNSHCLEDILFEGNISFTYDSFIISRLSFDSAMQKYPDDFPILLHQKFRAINITAVTFTSSETKHIIIFNGNFKEEDIIELFKYLLDSSLFTYKCGISELGSNIKCLSTLYKQAVSAFDECNFKEINFSCFSAIRHDNKNFIKKSEYISIVDAFNGADIGLLNTTLNQIFSKFDNTFLSKEEIVNTLVGIINYLYVNISDTYPDLCNINEIYNSIYSCHSVFKMKVIVKDTINGMYNTVNDKTTYMNYVVSYIKSYILNHYSEKISLHHFSDKMNFSYNYLSNMFSEKTGLCFSSYLMNFRLGKAKELLFNSHLKINEISDSCGFSDSKIFAKAFKKLYGITPKEFRNSIKHSDD